MGIQDFLVSLGVGAVSPSKTGGIAVRAPNVQSTGGNSDAAKVAALKKMGYSNAQIAASLSGNAPISGAVAGDSNAPGYSALEGLLGAVLPFGLNSAAASALTTRPKTPGIPSKSSSGSSTAGNVLSQIFNASPNMQTLAKLGQAVGTGAGKLGQQVGTAVAKKGKGGSNAGGAPGKQGNGGLADILGALQGGEYPDWNYTSPEITMRDFTDQANSKVAQAFAPLMAMYAQQIADTQARGNRNFGLVGGIYDKYVNSIGNDAAQTQQRYDSTEAERANQGTALANNVGDYYQSANQGTADLLKSIGGQQAAPELLQQGANEQAIQQGNIAQNTQAVNDYYGQQEQGAANQATAYQDAARNEGVRGQSNVLADTSAQIGGINSEQAKSQTQQGLTALDIAQQLAQNDYNTQVQNANMGMQGAQAGYQAQVGNYNAGRQNALDQLQQYQWQQEMNSRNGQFGQQMDLQRQQLGLDTAKFNLEAQQPGDPIQFSGANGSQTQLAQRYGPDLVSDVANAMYEATAGSGVRPGDPNMSNAYNAYLQKAQQLSAKYGIPVGDAVQALQLYWNENQAGAFGATPRVQ